MVAERSVWIQVQIETCALVTAENTFHSALENDDGKLGVDHVVGVLGAGEIVRLDGGRVYSLQPDSQSLTEETLSERRERLDRLAQSRGEPLPFKDVSSDIRPTGAQDTVNGFPCDEVVITVRGSFEDPATRQRTPVALEGDVWMASSFAGKSEIERFGRKYAEGLGFDPSSAVQSAMIDITGSIG